MKNLFIVLVLLFLYITSSIARTYRVLYLGNSLTYVNNVPDLVAQIALSHGDTIIWDSNTPGGHKILQHSTNPVSLTKISDRNWDIVIIQAQSQETAFPDFQLDTEIYPPAKFLTDSIHRNNICTRVLFYMPAGWKYGDNLNCAALPEICTYDGQFARIRQTHLNIADSMDAGIIPSGISYRRSRAIDSTINLWSSDNVHPSIFGSYLTALNIYAAITKQATLGTIYAPSGIGSTTTTYLQGIADTVVLDSLDKWKLNRVFVNDSVGFYLTMNRVWPSFYSHDGFTLYHDDFDTDSFYYRVQLSLDDIDNYTLDTTIGMSTNSDSIIFLFNDTIQHCRTDYTITQFHNSSCNIDTIVLRGYDVCEGLNDLPSNLSFNVYPNPVITAFTIEQVSAINKDFDIEITNMKGVLVLSTSLKDESKKTVNVESLQRGIYLLRIFNENESYTNKLVIY